MMMPIVDSNREYFGGLSAILLVSDSWIGTFVVRHVGSSLGGICLTRSTWSSFDFLP